MNRVPPTHRRSIRLAPLPLLPAAASCSDPSSPAMMAPDVEGALFAHTVSRPMKIAAGVLFVGEVVPAPPPCLQLFNSVISGTATHLGSFEGTGSTCILDVNAPDPNPPWRPAGPPPYGTATFSNPLWVLTAANGDELWLEAPQAMCVISLANNALRCEAQGQPVHFIVGGTGRFEGATGELESSSVNEDGQGPDDFRSQGWIRF